MTRVKICGITNLDDALRAIDLGADMLGFNFYAKSPRHISPNEVRRIVGHLPHDKDMVGVFVNADEKRICEIAESCSLNGVQLHGDETAEFISRLRSGTNAKIVKAFRIGPHFRFASIHEFDVDAVLLDAFVPGEFGGTGQRFEWGIAAEASGLAAQVFLAGGLTPANVADAIRVARPYAVDVASGVESSPGKKDPEKLRTFIANAKQA